MSIALEIHVPDYFPAEWVDEEPEDGEDAILVLIQRQRWFRSGDEYRIPFRFSGRARPGAHLEATVHKQNFERAIRVDLVTVEMPRLPSAVTDRVPPEMSPSAYMQVGDNLTFTVELTVS